MTWRTGCSASQVGLGSWLLAVHGAVNAPVVVLLGVCDLYCNVLLHDTADSYLLPTWRDYKEMVGWAGWLPACLTD